MFRNALNLTQLKVLIASMFGSAVISSQDPQLILNQTAKVLNKIGLMVTVKGRFVDKLEEMDGPTLPYGKTIEEYFMELPKVLDENRSGSEALDPKDPSFLPAYYSYSLPKKRIKITRRYDEYEEACFNEEQLLGFITEIEAAIYESAVVYRYGLKRELLGYTIELIESIMDATAGTTAKDGKYVNTYVPASANTLNQGDYVINNTDSTVRGIVLANKGEIAANTTFAQAVADGDIVVFDLITEIAKPTDASSGEAFIERVMDDVEIASDISEGHSLNGGTIGAVDDLKLYVPFGLKSVIGVKVKAGAFHKDELEIGASMKPLPNFGNYSGKTWAVLCDSRMFALFLGYDAVRTQMNADGDFLNIVRHLRHTPYASRCTFIKLYREPAAAKGKGKN